MEKSFSAYEYQLDEVFYKAEYRYQGSSDVGWRIFRDGELFESLGPGYVLLKTLYCGICSTDIARAKLPFPLPQITGHEIIALHHGEVVAVDINASHLARDISQGCYYCEQGMGSHCPDRLTLGIDRLPGGFSPYVLVPKKAIYPVSGKISPKLAVVVEPFSAALHAVESMHIHEGMQVAVVGPKRLGLLLILALNLFRKTSGLSFGISAIVRHAALSETCVLFGADDVLLTDDLGDKQYDIVFDTSGSVSGFKQSMTLAKTSLHVKSTHGLTVEGFEQLTRLVIDELSLYPVAQRKLGYLMASAATKNKRHLLLDERAPLDIRHWVESNFNHCVIVQANLLDISTDEMRELLPTEGFEKFDVALVSSMLCLNKVISFPGLGNLVRAKGEIFWCDTLDDKSELWSEFFKKSLCLRSSRCGDFSRALDLMSQNASFFSALISKYISGYYALEQINDAFEVAKSDASCIKLVITDHLSSSLK